MNPETLAYRICALKELGLQFNDEQNGYELKDIWVESSDLNNMSDEEFTHMGAEMKEFIKNNPSYQVAAAPQPSAELTIIDRATTELSAGSAILKKVQKTAIAFVSAADALIEKIKANGDKLSAELDIKANETVVKMTAAADEVDQQTKPIRRAMDLIRDQLLDSKKQIKAKADIIQGYRNKWAIECERVRKEEEDKQKAAAKKRQEVIDTRANIEKALLKYFGDHLLVKKQGVNAWFNAITLDNYDVRAQSLQESNPVYETAHFVLFKYSYTGALLTTVEVAEITKEACSEEKFKEFFDTYSREMLRLKAEKIELLGSKKGELERIEAFELEQAEEKKHLAAIEEEKKTANEARQKELKKLQEEAEARHKEALQKELEELEAQRIREEEECKDQEEKNRIALEAENKKVDVYSAQSSSISLFEQTTNSPVSSSVKTKKTLKAIITNPVGIYSIFQLWFENVGKDMGNDELMKKLDFMFTYASKRANAKQPLMLDTEISGKPTFVSYVEDLKAVTVKEKEQKEGIAA